MSLNGNWGGGTGNYSLTETVVGTWIDGKPIYQKTIVDTTSRTINTQTTIFIPSTLINVNEIVFLTGMVKNDVGRWSPLPLPSMSSDHSESLDYYQGNFRIITGSGTFVKIYITVQYTKTTD